MMKAGTDKDMEAIRSGQVKMTQRYEELFKEESEEYAKKVLGRFYIPPKD